MILRAMTFIGAVSLLGVGVVHLQQHLGADFRMVPTIGSLFLLNAIGCAMVGFTLLMPIERAQRAALCSGGPVRGRCGRRRGCAERRRMVGGLRYKRLVYATHHRARMLEIHTHYVRRQVLPLFGSRLILEITSRGSRPGELGSKTGSTSAQACGRTTSQAHS